MAPQEITHADVPLGGCILQRLAGLGPGICARTAHMRMIEHNTSGMLLLQATLHTPFLLTHEQASHAATCTFGFKAYCHAHRCLPAQAGKSTRHLRKPQLLWAEAAFASPEMLLPMLPPLLMPPHHQQKASYEKVWAEGPTNNTRHTKRECPALPARTCAILQQQQAHVSVPARSRNAQRPAPSGARLGTVGQQQAAHTQVAVRGGLQQGRVHLSMRVHGWCEEL